MKSLLIPKNFLALSLLIILLCGLIRFELVLIFKNLIFAVGTAFLTDLLFLKIRRVNIFPMSSLVSGLIIALLFSPDTAWYIFAASSFLAMAGKNLAHILWGRHLFNPAAAGIFLASLVFNQPLAWWGPSWGPIPYFLLIILVGFLVLFRMRRWRITLSFLAALAITAVFFSKIYNITIENPLVTIAGFVTDPTPLFFALVMLPEPMTSPADHKKQILYGAFVAIAVFLLGDIYAQFQLDPLITTLLLANLVFKFLSSQLL